MELELLLTWAVITTIFLIIIVGVLIKLQKKHEKNIQELESKLNKDYEREKSRSLEGQRSSVKGKINEQLSPYMPEFFEKYAASDARFLGSPIDFVIFKNMSQYDKTTKALDIPIDVILIEVKTGKSKTLTEKEKAIKIACDEGRVSFDKIDIDLDNEFTIKERLTEEHTPKKKENKNNNPQKIDAQKINPNAYESWTISDEEFFKNYWNDESNKLSEYEKIKELSQKTGRSKGAIVSKLEKMSLD